MSGFLPIAGSVLYLQRKLAATQADVPPGEDDWIVLSEQPGSFIGFTADEACPPMSFADAMRIDVDTPFQVLAGDSDVNAVGGTDMDAAGLWDGGDLLTSTGAFGPAPVMRKQIDGQKLVILVQMGSGNLADLLEGRAVVTVMAIVGGRSLG